MPFSDNKYLVDILAKVTSLMPELKFNSVLITKFRDGTDNLSYHSDI